MTIIKQNKNLTRFPTKGAAGSNDIMEALNQILILAPAGGATSKTNKI